MSYINDTSAKINDLKINISKAIVIYAFNNFNLHFEPYLAILSHNIQEKKKLSNISELTKTLTDEQMYLSNENREIVNYTRNLKPKKGKPSEQRGKEDTKKGSDNKKKNRKQEVKKYKTCGKKNLRDYWYLRIECFVCHNMRYIVAKYPEKSNFKTSTSQTVQIKKRLYYTQKVTQSLNSKTKIDQVLVLYLVISRPQNFPITFIIINSRAIDHFFCN